MAVTLNLSVKRRLQQVGLEDAVLTKNSADILKSLLQILVADRTHLSPRKLQIVIIIEEEWENFLLTSNDVTLAVSAFHALVKSSNESHNYVLQGQCLMSATSFLLMSLQKVGMEELHKCFTSHLEYLLTLLSQTNNSQNIYLRSVAATCLTEVELTIQGILLECFDVIYTLTAFETSIAHQQYLELLCVLMGHSQDGSNQTQDVPVFHVPPSLNKIVSAGNKFSKSEVEQMAAFALDQLPLLTTTVSARVTVQIAALLKLLNPQASLSSVHLLQPVLQQYLYSYNLTACQLVLRLERDFKTSEHFKDDSYRQSIVEHLSHCSTLSTLPVSSRLIFVSWLKQFLAGHPEKSQGLHEKNLLQPQNKDGSHTRLKKFEILPYLLQNVKDDSMLIKLIDFYTEEVTAKAMIKVRAVFIKILYLITKYFEDHEDVKYAVKRCLVDVTVKDVTFSPFLLNILQAMMDVTMKMEILGTLIPELMKSNKSSHENFLSSLEIMMYAVETQNINIAQPREILTYVASCLETFKSHVTSSHGHHVLSLCHKIMKLFDVREFVKEMERVLRILQQKCIEEDVLNRAQSYVTLLTCLSDQKVKDMLKAQKRNISQMVITEGMFHKPDTLQVLDFVPFKLQKQSHISVPRAKPGNEEIADSSATNFLDGYFENIAANASANAITIPITITLTDGCQQDVTAIQAAIIFFTPNFTFGRLETLMIGNLTQKVMLSPKKEISAVIKYFPEKPYPVNLSARSEFAMNGACFCSPLESFAIDFINLFQPLPVPEEFFNSSRHYRRKLFSQLWDDMNQESGMNNCISATVVNRLLSQIHLKMKNEMKPFVIQKGAHEADIGIYLAPTNHVLLKVVMSEDSSIFSIVTDDIYLLAHVNDFLSHW